MFDSDSILIAVLTGKEVVWPESATSSDVSNFLEAAEKEGVGLLVYQKLRHSRSISSWPDKIWKVLKEQCLVHGAKDAIQARRLSELLQALAAIGVFPILLKGIALAYTHYPYSILRPRTDIDFLITKNQIRDTADVLHKLGYSSNSRSNLSENSLISHQTLFSKRDWNDYPVLIDVHWKVSNPVAFSDILSYEELESRSVKVPALGKFARAAGPVDALLIACVHSIAHHYDEERLIWLYDVALLSQSLTESEQQLFHNLIDQKQITSVCSSVISRASDRFDKKLSIPVKQEDLEDSQEVSAKYLNPNLQMWSAFLLDWKQLRGRKKIQLVIQHLFPSPRFMMKKYSVSSRLVLPFLYIHRIFGGLQRWWPSLSVKRK